ncbi:unnamed protein product [Sphenostylis stenocarpa]|uniref:HTH OST-type domain-containing protein n=1 Tax=Sphenostylis stenocarpa TaxID=92480 RepID=A0AA86SX86_9FABA|nr:unnamed protein product [Sphenostylis stenocarpa]
MRPLLQTKQMLVAGVQRRELCYEYRDIKISVWWDFENCQVPVGVDVWDVAPAITKAVRASGIKGPLRINAFGDVMQLSKSNREALSHTGIDFTHNPGGKDNADRFLLVNVMDWVSQNPPPAHHFLISADKDFAAMLHRLRMHNYNILLATSRNAPRVLCSAATIIWQWSSLVKGENLFGKHFNHPHDGLFGSWYGDYKVIPKKPFSDVEKSSSSQKVDIYKPSEDIHTDPKEVVIQIFRVLRSYPKGISIVDLRAELKKRKVYFGKRFYGYGTFSRFLLSTLQVELAPLGCGNFHVSLVPSESPIPFEGKFVESVTSYIKIDEKESAATPNLNGEDKNKARQENVSRPPNVLQKFSVCSGKVVDEVCQNSYSLPVGDSMLDKIPSGSDKTYRNGPTFFGWIRSWLQFWKGNIKSGVSADYQNKAVFDFEDSNTSELLVEEDMMHKLQKYGLPVFRSLPGGDILQLVELLISEKRWLEESPSRIFPFSVTQPAQRNSDEPN